MIKFLSLIALCFFLTLANCGGSGGTTGDDDDDDNDTGDTINTEKLIGTPFEGMETGDEISSSFFSLGDYATTTVDSVPIPVFLAYFTLSQEATIQEGIEIANDGAGFEAFEVIDTWQDDARPIYKADCIISNFSGECISSLGATYPEIAEFEGKSTSGVIVIDWQIVLKGIGFNKWTVAHELGHAFGIINHAMIDYENDILLSEEENNGLEENSLMDPDGHSDPPALNDYNLMMRMQGELLLRHLGESADFIS